MHSRTAEQSVEEGLANPLRFFANLLTGPFGFCFRMTND